MLWVACSHVYRPWVDFIDLIEWIALALSLGAFALTRTQRTSEDSNSEARKTYEAELAADAEKAVRFQSGATGQPLRQRTSHHRRQASPVECKAAAVKCFDERRQCVQTERRDVKARGTSDAVASGRGCHRKEAFQDAVGAPQENGQLSNWWTLNDDCFFECKGRTINFYRENFKITSYLKAAFYVSSDIGSFRSYHGVDWKVDFLKAHGIIHLFLNFSVGYDPSSMHELVFEETNWISLVAFFLMMLIWWNIWLSGNHKRLVCCRWLMV